MATIRTSSSASVFIVPRRKLLGSPNAKLSDGIEITTDTIQRLCWLSQAEAAAKLGLSLTALKRACRSLGYEKWPRDVDPEARQRNEALVHNTETKQESFEALRLVAPGCTRVGGPESNEKTVAYFEQGGSVKQEKDVAWQGFGQDLQLGFGFDTLAPAGFRLKAEAAVHGEQEEEDAGMSMARHCFENARIACHKFRQQAPLGISPEEAWA